MERLQILISVLALAVLAACSGGKFSTDTQSDHSAQFQQEQRHELEALEKFQRVETPARPWVRRKAPQSSVVIRAAKKTDLKNIKTQIEGNQAQLVADVELNGQQIGQQKFSGVLENQEAVLEPMTPEFQGLLKAKIICTDEGEKCSEYFIDVFYMLDQKIYVDQFVMNVPQQKEKPQVEPTQPKPTPPTTIQTPGASKYSDYDLQEQFFDEAQGDQAGSYVGTSETEILNLFEVKAQIPGKENKPEPVKPETGTKPPLPTGPIKPPTAPEPAPAPSAPAPTPAPAATPAPIKPEPTPTSSNQEGPSQQILPEGVKEPTDQAIRMPYRGTLSKATDFLAIALQFDVPFKIYRPERKRHFGTYDLAEFLVEIGSYARTLVPNYKILTGDISAEKGGRLGSHSSHQNGLDVDLSYMVKDEALQFVNLVNGEKLNRSFMLEEQWKLTKYIFQTGMVEMIFVSPVIKKALCYQAQQSGDLKDRNDRGTGYEILKRLKNWAGHENHYHVRIRCSDNNPRCHQDVYSFPDSGCF